MLQGRLKFVLGDSVAEENTDMKLFTFGGRSFSIWSLPDMHLAYDSGHVIGYSIYDKFPVVFNGRVDEVENTPYEDRDDRSDDKVIYCMCGVYVCVC